MLPFWLSNPVVSFNAHTTTQSADNPDTSPAGFPLPNPDLLRLHAAECKVARLSGASLIYNVLREVGALEGPPDLAEVWRARLSEELGGFSST